LLQFLLSEFARFFVAMLEVAGGFRHNQLRFFFVCSCNFGEELIGLAT
jgi:hypothetical protein